MCGEREGNNEVGSNKEQWQYDICSECYEEVFQMVKFWAESGVYKTKNN